MILNLKTAKILWFITTLFTLIAALGGAISKDIYKNLFPNDFLPGALPQDILTILVCFLLLALITTTKENDLKKQIIIIGLLGSLFYLYGIYSIERIYNSFYLIYLAIFALSFWSIIYSLAGFYSKEFSNIRLNDSMRKVTAFSSFIIAAVFTVLWIFSLIPLMKEHNRIEFLYSIYILDLCFVMPAFFITAYMSLRKKVIGVLLSPAIMILGFFVIFPLGLNELAKPFFGMTINYGAMAVSFIFSFYMLIIAILQLRMIKV